MGVQADNLAGEYFITTGSGKYFRNVELDPEHNMGIVEINDKGRQLAHRLGAGRRRAPDERVPQPLHESLRPQGGDEWREPRHLPLPRHQRDCHDLHSAADRGFSHNETGRSKASVFDIPVQCDKRRHPASAPSGGCSRPPDSLTSARHHFPEKERRNRSVCKLPDWQGFG